MKTFLQYCTEEGEAAPALAGTNTDSVAGLKGEPPVFPDRKKRKLGFANQSMLKRMPAQNVGTRSSN